MNHRLASAINRAELIKRFEPNPEVQALAQEIIEDLIASAEMYEEELRIIEDDQHSDEE
jgi:hypothetical protein